MRPRQMLKIGHWLEKEIQEKISELTRIKTALEHLASSCDGNGSLDESPIVEALD